MRKETREKIEFLGYKFQVKASEGLRIKVAFGRRRGRKSDLPIIDLQSSHYAYGEISGEFFVEDFQFGLEERYWAIHGTLDWKCIAKIIWLLHANDSALESSYLFVGRQSRAYSPYYLTLIVPEDAIRSPGWSG